MKNSFAVKDVTKINGEILCLIQNPWGSDRNNKFNIDSKDSDNFLENNKNHNYASFKNSEYSKTGTLLLNLKDIKKNFKSACCLDFQPGKYIYKESISKEQLERNQKKEFDFLLNFEKDDEIRIDVTNLNTDLQSDNRDSSCISHIIIYNVLKWKCNRYFNTFYWKTFSLFQIRRL